MATFDWMSQNVDDTYSCDAFMWQIYLVRKARWGIWERVGFMWGRQVVQWTKYPILWRSEQWENRCQTHWALR